MFEGLGKAVERCAQVLGLGLAGALLASDRLAPDAGDVRRRGLQACRQAFELLAHGLGDGVLQGGGFAGQAVHRGLHDRLQGLAGGARALRHAVLHGLLHDGRQPGVGGFGLALKGGLAGDLAFVQRLVLLFHALHHGFQLADDGGHGFGLPLHDLGLALEQLEGFFALVALRVHAQRGRGPGIETLRRVDAVAPRQRGQQAQHGGRGNAGDRGAEGKAQPLDGGGQRRADRGQIGRAFKRKASAAQRDDHAKKGAQHAQKDQQADQIRRERRAGQAHALAFDTQAHGVAQSGRKLVQPGAKAARRFVQVRYGARERRGCLLVAQQFQRARQVTDADQQRHGQRQRVRARVTRADPAHNGQSGQENHDIDQILGHSVLISWCEGRRAALRPVVNEHPIRPAERRACRRGTCPATRRR